MRQTEKLPTRLRSEPLVDAIFEMHFQADAAVEVLPGYLFSKLEGEKRIDRLPANSIPAELRRQGSKLAAQLAAQPVLKLQWSRYILSFGDGMFGIACQLPYPGWAVFREEILNLTTLVITSGVITRISRFDLRYVDLIDGEGPTDLGPKLDATLHLGGMALTESPFNLQAVVERGGMSHHVTLVLPMELMVAGAQNRRRGLLSVVNTSTIYDRASVLEFTDFLRQKLDAVHAANKETFFACLTDAAVQAMGPET